MTRLENRLRIGWCFAMTISANSFASTPPQPVGLASSINEKRKGLGRRLIASGPLLVSAARIDLRHQDRAKRKFADLGFSRQTAQITPSGIDRRPPLQDTRDDDGCGHLAHNLLRLLPGVRADAQHRSYNRRGGQEIAPVRNPALRIIDDVRTCTQDHSQWIRPLPDSRWLRLWLSSRRPAFSEARFKINEGIWI